MCLAATLSEERNCCRWAVPSERQTILTEVPMWERWNRWLLAGSKLVTESHRLLTDLREFESLRLIKHWSGPRVNGDTVR